MQWTQRAAGALLGVAVMAGAASCSSSDSTLDANKLERDIQSSLGRSNNVSGVTCPDGVKLEKGTTFTCTARVEHQKRVIFVKLTSNKRLVFQLKK